MKLLPIVVVTLLVTTTLGAGMVPVSAPPSSEGQAPAVGLQPPNAQIDEPTTVNASVTNVLSIPAGEIERTNIRRQHADLGPAAGFDTGVTTERLGTRALEQELDDISAPEELETRLTEEISALETEVDTLKDRERTAVRAFSREDIGPRELVIELSAIHTKALGLQDRLVMLESQAATLDEGSVSSRRIQDLDYDLQMLRGPLRAHAAAVLRAERPANRIMVETSETSIAMTAIDDGEYLREVHRKQLRGQGSGQLTPERVEELTQQQYPTLWNRSTSWSSDGSESVFMMSVNFDQGGLQTFIDGPTERTFIEHQRLPLETVITGSELTKTQDGLNVTVEQTYAGGPLRLTVTDADTGEPVQATLTVGQDGQDSQTVGTAGEDGTLWTISPRGSFTVTILGEGTAAAFVDVTPPTPETVITSQ